MSRRLPLIPKYDIGDALRYFGADPPPHGGRRKMRCPFHDDRNPSASVDYERNSFHCFVCDFRGDAIDLLAREEGLSSAAAISRAKTVFGTGSVAAQEEPGPSSWLFR